jgi:hypothetical protein
VKPRSTTALIREQANQRPDSRLLTCTNCKENIRVYELPGPWIQPLSYVCGLCLTSSAVDTSCKPRLSVLGDAA